MKPGERYDENKKLLTVIIPTYNAESYISECLNSLEILKGISIDIIIVDGGSTDNTMSIVSRYKNLVTHAVSEKDRGIYDAMNKGVAMAQSEFIYFLGADDIFILQPGEVKSILKEPGKIYYGNVAIKEKGMEIYGSEFKDYTIINRNLCHQSIFYPRKVFEANNYNLKYKLVADYAFNLALWGSRKFEFVYVNKVIANYSINGLSSKKIDSEFKKDVFKIVYKNFGIKGVFLKLLNPLRNIFQKRIYEY